jgi:hypothetical protein
VAAEGVQRFVNAKKTSCARHPTSPAATPPQIAANGDNRIMCIDLWRRHEGAAYDSRRDPRAIIYPPPLSTWRASRSAGPAGAAAEYSGRLRNNRRPPGLASGSGVPLASGSTSSEAHRLAVALAVSNVLGT